MSPADHDLSRSLHRLTARLDRSADAFLRARAGVSYPRFLALYMVSSEGADTQRALAERLGVSEPSVSRLVRHLVEGGWLHVVAQPGGGNRNQLTLTSAGQRRAPDKAWSRDGELSLRTASQRWWRQPECPTARIGLIRSDCSQRSRGQHRGRGEPTA